MTPCFWKSSVATCVILILGIAAFVAPKAVFFRAIKKVAFLQLTRWLRQVVTVTSMYLSRWLQLVGVSLFSSSLLFVGDTTSSTHYSRRDAVRKTVGKDHTFFKLDTKRLVLALSKNTRIEKLPQPLTAEGSALDFEACPGKKWFSCYLYTIARALEIDWEIYPSYPKCCRCTQPADGVWFAIWSAPRNPLTSPASSRFSKVKHACNLLNMTSHLVCVVLTFWMHHQ